jgi:uncharacterized membrane protein
VTAEKWALFFHLLGAFLFVGGTIVAGVAFEVARRRQNPAEIAAILQLARVGVVLVGPGGLLVLAFGLWLVNLQHVGYGAGWVDAALVLFVAAGALGSIAGQKPKRARELALQGHDVHELLDDPMTRALNYLAAAIVVAIVALMVFKP